jgi:hypothetical protein
MAQKKINWARAYMITGAIDIIQPFIDVIFPPFGEGLNLGLDAVIGVVITFWAWRKGLLDPLNLTAIGVTLAVEEFTFGSAPLWIGDIGILHYRSGGMLASITGSIDKIASTGLNQGGRREPTGRSEPLNQGGSRRPM